MLAAGGKDRLSKELHDHMDEVDISWDMSTDPAIVCDKLSELETVHTYLESLVNASMEQCEESLSIRVLGVPADMGQAELRAAFESTRPQLRGIVRPLCGRDDQALLEFRSEAGDEL